MQGHVTRMRACALALTALLFAPAAAEAHRGHHGRHGGGMKNIRHMVVIYEENHSFDNLYGRWEGVDGLRRADAAHTKQVSQDGKTFTCLHQTDVNLTSPPLQATCTDSTVATTPFSSAFTNDPFQIEKYIPRDAKTCPAPGVFAPNGVLAPTGLPGGCTRDLVHRFYQEQYQLDGGKQDRYMTGSDATGLTMGYYDTKQLPVYRYLHSQGAPSYVIADRFFQAAFGGSFLNHQWLVAAASPTWPAAPADQHSKVDPNGMPNSSYPLYKTDPTKVSDKALTQACPAATAGLACGDWAVNTIQPTYQPYQPTAPGGTPPAKLPPQKGTTIGDRLSAKGVDWAWYSGGWSNANGDKGAPGWTNGDGPTCGDAETAANAVFPNCPNKLFQFHHQPFNYYETFAPGTAMRTQHLRDEAEFIAAANGSQRSCDLKPVSFIKPIGAENEHPGYASEHTGSDHLVDLLKSINGSRCAKDTMVVVTYDEFGGSWDHVPPPGQGTTTSGPHDEMGPGTRIPALVVGAGLKHGAGVDHASHDTTSIMATIEHRYGLAPVGTRDATVQDLSTVFGGRGHGHGDDQHHHGDGGGGDRHRRH